MMGLLLKEYRMDRAIGKETKVMKKALGFRTE